MKEPENDTVFELDTTRKIEVKPQAPAVNIYHPPSAEEMDLPSPPELNTTAATTRAAAVAVAAVAVPDLDLELPPAPVI